MPDLARGPNPWRQLDLWVHPQRSDPAYDAKRAALTGIEQTYDFRGTVRARPDRTTPDGFVVELSPQLLATLRVIVATGADETSDAALAALAVPGARPFSPRNESAALGALTATLRSRQVEASKRVEALRLVVAGDRGGGNNNTGQARRRAMALRVQAEENSLLLDAILTMKRGGVVIASS